MQRELNNNTLANSISKFATSSVSRSNVASSKYEPCSFIKMLATVLIMDLYNINCSGSSLRPITTSRGAKKIGSKIWKNTIDRIKLFFPFCLVQNFLSLAFFLKQSRAIAITIANKIVSYI